MSGRDIGQQDNAGSQWVYGELSDPAQLLAMLGHDGVEKETMRILSQKSKWSEWGASSVESLRKSFKWAIASSADGRTYYYEKTTKETSWAPPAEVELANMLVCILYCMSLCCCPHDRRPRTHRVCVYVAASCRH